ncbi:hypothetical protein K470DRAFT_255502 [Piedraia hortae CBS 480.64]|uniref:Uncharacterized protein n=1 Tax=Piedraia hortae CBS 480.64 TaxID=1314780 RepID=A0A6A7C7M5_9PEZI|nr:hypothetical protein K470DRAFT_255502 [Piedraia hortae CBS 480.64]
MQLQAILKALRVCPTRKHYIRSISVPFHLDSFETVLNTKLSLSQAPKLTELTIRSPYYCMEDEPEVDFPPFYKGTVLSQWLFTLNELIGPEPNPDWQVSSTLNALNLHLIRLASPMDNPVVIGRLSAIFALPTLQHFKIPGAAFLAHSCLDVAVAKTPLKHLRLGEVIIGDDALKAIIKYPAAHEPLVPVENNYNDSIVLSMLHTNNLLWGDANRFFDSLAEKINLVEIVEPICAKVDGLFKDLVDCAQPQGFYCA